MLAIVHLCLIGVLAYALQFRAELADHFHGLPRYLLSLQPKLPAEPAGP